MPLPDKVIDQLGADKSQSQGWAFGLIFFSGAMLALMIALYVGITYVYVPHLNAQLRTAQDQVKQVGVAISPADQAQVVNFYSQVSNLKKLLATHPLTSQLFAWLEKNTEANISYSSFQLASGNRVALKGSARTETDINQQIAIFENAPEVSSVAVSDISNAQVGSGYQFDVVLTMTPSVFAPAASS